MYTFYKVRIKKEKKKLEWLCLGFDLLSCFSLKGNSLFH